MHFIFFKGRRWRKIRFDSEPDLQCVCEIIESGYHHAFQNLFFTETKRLELDNVPTRKLRTARSQFDSEVKQRLVGDRQVRLMIVHRDLVALLRGLTQAA